MELISEMRTPAQALNYALAREREQQNQKEILRGNNSNWNTTVAHLSARKTRPFILPTPSTKQYPQCWRCGVSFTPNHINNCPEKYHNAIFPRSLDILQICADHNYPHFQKTEVNINRDNKLKQET